jgi:hypothetical protein
MSTPIPDRRPGSDPAAQNDTGVERSSPDHTAPSGGATAQPNVRSELGELADRSRAEGVPPRSPRVVFASPGSAPQSQPPLADNAYARPAPGAARITSPDELRALLDSRQSETVDTLIVVGPFDERDFRLFPKSVRHLTLDIEGGATPAALAYLEALPLRSLSAEPRTQAGNEGAIVLGRHPTLESVVMPANGIGDRGAQGLSQSATLRSADLSENSIGDKGGTAFVHSAFEELLFYENELGPKSAAALIRESRAIALGFGGNPIREASEIAFEVSQNTRLKFLDLGNCHLGNAELGLVATNPSIESLGLDGNTFNILGLRTLASNRTLKSLKVADNDRLFDDSAILLSRMTWLKELSVGGIEFGDDGFRALAKLHQSGVRVEADWPAGLP